jgi:hypothetical protein
VGYMTPLQPACLTQHCILSFATPKRMKWQDTRVRATYLPCVSSAASLSSPPKHAEQKPERGMRCVVRGCRLSAELETLCIDDGRGRGGARRTKVAAWRGRRRGLQ